MGKSLGRNAILKRCVLSLERKVGKEFEFRVSGGSEFQSHDQRYMRICVCEMKKKHLNFNKLYIVAKSGVKVIRTYITEWEWCEI